MSINDQKSNVVERIIQHSKIIPEKQAFDDLTYASLARKMCALSSKIKGSKVLVACEKREDSYIGMLASLHSGATYSPVDVSAPHERINKIINNFEPTDIIIGKNDQNRFGNVHRVGSEGSVFQQSPSDLAAYVIFTSGSTGSPKGVVISRKAMNHFIDWSSSSLDINSYSKVSQHPNVAFDLSVLDIFTALNNAAELFPLQSPIDRMFPGRSIKKYELTHWVSVPSVIDIIAKDTTLQKNDFSSLKTMIFCGEPLLPRHLEYIFNINNKLKVINTYGPTEATVCMTQIELDHSNWRSRVSGSVALGSPIPGMHIELHGGKNQKEGEIIISGPQVAEGYWLQSEMTEKAFKSQKYHSGDWAEIIDGELYFKSRIDRQIKLNGFRVELGDIEQALYEITSRAVACVKHDDRIIAFVEAESLNQDDLHEKIAQSITEYMRPHQIIALNEFPRNVNDKIDYNKLQDIVG